MEDDRVEANNDGKGQTTGRKAVWVGAAMVTGLFLFLGFAPDWINPSIPSGAPPKATTAEVAPAEPASMSEVANALQTKPASLEDYKQVAKVIGDRKDAIYMKAFAKAPDRFKGERVRIRVKVMDIKEQDGVSLMNVWLSRNMEPGVVTYNGPLDVYDGDIITVYGDVLGSLEGTNRMGAQMTWPAIEAKYVKVIQRGSAE